MRSLTSTVTVVVEQTLTAISVQTPSPSSPISGGGSYFFQTGGTDQFGNPMGASGAAYTVTSGSGTVSASSDPPGVEFHAPGGTSAETDTITMTDGTFTKTITVSVSPSLTGGHWGTTQDPAQDQPTVTPMGAVTITDPADGIFGASVPFTPTEYQAKAASGQSASVSISGASLAFQFFWVPDFPGGTAPPMTYFRVTPTAVSEGFYYPDSGPAGSASASDGLGDAEQDSDGTFGDGTLTISAGSSGTHLMPEDTHSGTASFSVQNISAAATGAAQAIAEVGVGATPVAAPDVSVSSPSNGAIVPAGSDVMLKVHADPTFVYDPSNPINPLQSLSVQVTGGSGGGGSLTPDANGNASMDLGTLATGTYTATATAKYENSDGSQTPVVSAPSTFYVAAFAVKTGSWNPQPAYVGQIISGQVQGSLDPSSFSGGGGSFVVYNWTTAGVWYSQDGTAGTFEPYGGNAIVAWTQGQASTTFSAQFGAPGQYLLEVVCTATVYSQYNGSVVATFTQSGYIGGSASDIDMSGGQAGHARKVHQKTAQGKVAHLASGGAGITVVPATVTFFDTSIKLGIGAPTAYQKIITAVVTPGYEINNISFTALNNFGGPSNEVSVLTDTEDLATGIVKLLITATSFTPPATGGAPDCVVAATVNSYVGATTLASATALVLKPWDFTESPTSGVAKPTNKYFLPAGPNNIPPATSIPADWGISTPKTGHVYFATHEEADVVITITDQFGNNLDPIYDGYKIVDETFAGDPRRQNVPITFPDGLLSNGQIKDAIDVNQADDVTDTGKTLAQEESNWGSFHQLLSGAADGTWDNAIAGNLVKDLVLPDLEQSITVGGVIIANIWTRNIFLFKEDVIHHNKDLDGITMSYTEVPLF